MDNKLKVIIKFAACLVLSLIAYIPTIWWMIDRWSAKESYYSHGFLIPIISVFIMWQKRSVLGKIKISGNMLGLWIITLCLLIHVVCAALRIYFLSGFTLIMLIYGMVLFFFGLEMIRKLTFPILFLFAMVPLPLAIIGNLTVQLKLLATQLSVLTLNKIGFRCIQDGSFIRMPSSFIEVAAPCSGLRSIISLVTLGLLFAYVVKTSFLKKSILFLSSFPIAIATNVMRITMVSIVNDLYGGKVAMGVFHDFTGFLVFAAAFLGLFGIAQLIGAKQIEI
ncbi:MAG: exosortase/archaeosortase family protein [Candidatus Omnitrophota bacterium]|nr:exosortase/archaeosortase family protein [Candidatus Omnitrophota bacterium]